MRDGRNIFKDTKGRCVFTGAKCGGFSDNRYMSDCRACSVSLIYKDQILSGEIKDKMGEEKCWSWAGFLIYLSVIGSLLVAAAYCIVVGLGL